MTIENFNTNPNEETRLDKACRLREECLVYNRPAEMFFLLSRRSVHRERDKQGYYHTFSIRFQDSIPLLVHAVRRDSLGKPLQVTTRALQISLPEPLLTYSRLKILEKYNKKDGTYYVEYARAPGTSFTGCEQDDCPRDFSCLSCEHSVPQGQWVAHPTYKVGMFNFIEK